MQVWSRSRESLEQSQGEDQEQAGTDLSKISCSARWGQGEKESAQLKSPQKPPQTQQSQDLGSSVPLPDPEKPPFTPTPALGRSRSIQDPFSSAERFPLPNSENEWEWLKAIHCMCGWSTVCCPLSVLTPLGQAAGTACAPSKQPQGLQQRREAAEGLSQESGDLMVRPTHFCMCWA